MVRIPLKPVLRGFLKTHLLVALCLSITASCSGQTIDESKAEAESNYNWQVATLGGTQFWTDIRVVGGWRVQRNSYFGHFRLLDDSNVRQAWGNEDACQALLDKHLAAGNVSPYRGKVVILLHGLCRTWKSMQKTADYLESKGYEVILFRYASSREQVADHAKHLDGVIESLPQSVTEINFVAHSLGNIVIRHYAADCAKSKSGKVDPRIRRMVMLGPPNQGSRMARLLKDNVGFKLVAGASGAELSMNWEDLAKNLATPKFEFGIVAGGFGDDETPFNNILLPGKDDFTVSEWETMLPGARDFIVRPWLHSTIMNEPTVLNATATFLKHGYFISEKQRKPIHSLPEYFSSREARKDKGIR